MKNLIRKTMIFFIVMFVLACISTFVKNNDYLQAKIYERIEHDVCS